MKALLFVLALGISCANEAQAQTANTQPGSRTMASLLADGYEPQTVQIFKDKIWMRKLGDETGYVCERGRIGSAAFDAYREKKYDLISCSAPSP